MVLMAATISCLRKTVLGPLSYAGYTYVDFVVVILLLLYLRLTRLVRWVPHMEKIETGTSSYFLCVPLVD